MVYGYYSYYGFTIIDGTITMDFSSEEEAREVYEKINLIDGPDELEDVEDE